MSERISSAEVARAFDDFLETSGILVPNQLHRLVAEYTGLHPTTVLRYHRQELESADAKVLDCLVRIEERIRSGEPLFEHDEASAPEGRWIGLGVQELQHWFDRVIDLLEDQGQYLLYRYVAGKLGVHPTTVMRYHRGELAGDPSRVVPILRDLHRKLESGTTVEFRHGPDDAERVVPRRCFLDLVDEIGELGLVPVDGQGGEPGLDEEVERMAGLKRGTVERIRASSSWPFVKLDLYEKLRAARERSIYDPCRHYELGDRLYHHDLGVGTVVEKCHKSRIIVEFAYGIRRVLREDVWVDPRWPYPRT
jgi:transcriptional regulator with XRE-family HTH domain